MKFFFNPFLKAISSFFSFFFCFLKHTVKNELHFKFKNDFGSARFFLRIEILRDFNLEQF